MCPVSSDRVVATILFSGFWTRHLDRLVDTAEWTADTADTANTATSRHSPHHGQDVLGLDAAQPPVDPLPAGVALEEVPQKFPSEGS